MGKYEEAYKLWNQALSHDQNHQLVIYNYGIAKAIRNYGDYFETFRLLNLTPENPTRNYMIALLLIKCGKFRGIFIMNILKSIFFSI